MCRLGGKLAGKGRGQPFISLWFLVSCWIRTGTSDNSLLLLLGKWNQTGRGSGSERRVYSPGLLPLLTTTATQHTHASFKRSKKKKREREREREKQKKRKRQLCFCFVFSITLERTSGETPRLSSSTCHLRSLGQLTLTLVAQFPHLENGSNITYLPGFMWEWWLHIRSTTSVLAVAIVTQRGK